MSGEAGRQVSRHYFVYGNTAQGFVNKLSSNLQGIERLVILRGWPGTGKACFMRTIADECEKTGSIPEYLHCPSAPDTYDGIIVPELRLAVVDGTDLHYTKLITSEPAALIIDTASAFDGAGLRESQGEISELISNIGACHESAFDCFKNALRVHDEWEKIYIANMDFSKADLLASYVAELLLGGHRPNRTPVVKERFFGAGTPSGAMDFIENLTEGYSKRYFLKGRPGTGKSTLLRKLATASAERGLDTEVYSCAFDSTSLDMLIWPELDKCLFDSTAPHLYEPSRPSDEIIDMYASCVRPGTDEKYEKELEDITGRYKKAVTEGTGHLAEAKESLDALMDIYAGQADTGEVDRLCAEVAGQRRG
jgi:hypothetical protein